MAGKRNAVNALAICTIVICGVGLAGSLIEQLQGSADNDQVGGVETTTESGQMFELSSESEANTTAPMELVRFTLDEFPKPKLCELLGVAIGMLIGIFALFSGVIEKQACYVASMILSLLDAATSAGMLGFVLYLLIHSDALVSDSESFSLRWQIVLPVVAMGLNIPLKIAIGVLSLKLMRNFDEYTTN